MQQANIMLNIGGSGDTQVFKENVTPSEVAILQLIHGNDSVTNIDVLGEVERTNRQERQRLTELYGKNRDGNFVSPELDSLFPGVATRLYEKFGELELGEEFFAVKKSKRDALDHDDNGKKGGAAKPIEKQSKAELIATAKAAGIEVDEKAKADEIRADVVAGLADKAAKEDDEPIVEEDEGEMPDGNIFK